MSAQPRPRSVVISDQLYRLLIRIYPANFRRAFGEEMALLFRDVCQDKVHRYGGWGLWTLWLYTLVDWGKTLCEQHIQEAFHMSGKAWMIRIGALAAMVGGVLGLYFVFQAANSYGNYGWDGGLVFVIPLLFALGIGGGMALYGEQVGALGRSGLLTIMAGLILQSAGFLIEFLWPFIFMGPLIIVPVGAILLVRSNLQRAALPAWWRYFALLIFVVALAGFGIEMVEGIFGPSEPDRGVQFAEALFSLAWLGLGIGLWFYHGDRADDTPLVA